jgi:hypothetical protein
LRVWPLEPHADVLRVGAHAIELWRSEAGGRRLVVRNALERRCSVYDARGLVDALAATAARADGGRAVLVFESALMPLLLVDTGGSLWRDEQLNALLRHRFRVSYGGADGDVDAWRVRTDFRFGERFAIGYAMAPAVEEIVRRALARAKLRCRGWHPALAWGLAAARPVREMPRGTGWFGWSEQDRTLLVRLERGRAVRLHPAAPAVASCEAIEALVDGQAMGASTPGGSIVVASWQASRDLPAATPGVRWRSLATNATPAGESAVRASRAAPST